MLDDGSTITLINQNFVRQLGIKGAKLKLEIKGINNREVVAATCEKVEFNIIVDDKEYRVQNAVAVPNLSLPAQTLSKETVRNIAKMENIFVQPYQNARPDILIGQDNWELLVTRETRAVTGAGIALSLTTLGWVVHGIIKPTSLCREIRTCATADSEEQMTTVNERDEHLDVIIKEYFQIDNFGVREITRPCMKHARSMSILENTTKRTDKGWETGLLWKKDILPLCDTYKTAFERLLAEERKIDKKELYGNLYYREMQRLIDVGYARRVLDDEVRSRRWFVSHFGVYNINKPNKIRIVFDLAEKTNGQSLNDQLDQGPDLLQPLPGVLIRFRLYAVAVKADISDMYMRVGVIEKDRGAQSFLWRGRERKGEPRVYEMTCLLFGAKPSQCSAIYVKDKNADLFVESKPDAVDCIKQDCYADDILFSRKTVHEAEKLVRDIVEINATANFIMHGWSSNEVRAIESVKEEARARKAEKSQLCSRGGERVLGLFWDVSDNSLGFNVGIERIANDLVSGARKPTKREFLKTIMAVYDPLGLMAPFTLKSKILMQEIWRSGICWDEPLRDEEQIGWLEWLKYLKEVSSYRVPRCITPKLSPYTQVELHVFCDASLKAYSAATYARFVSPAVNAHVTLVMAKSRVAPLKPLSIPRPELQAALLGARLIKTVAEEMKIKISRRILWSDSITVIRWIKSEPRTKHAYVAHRLGEIGELTDRCDWRWVPTNKNPADIATRWTNNNNIKNDLWFASPDFLRAVDETNWPKEKGLTEDEKERIDQMEIRKAFVYIVDISAIDIPVIAKFLGWRGLLVSARRVLKIVNKWRSVNKCRETSIINNVNDIKYAENYWFRVIQNDCFKSEIDAIRAGKLISKNSKIANVKPFLDVQNLLRAEGRVTKLHGENFNNQPIILAGDHPAVRLFIKEYHRKMYHANGETVINELRQRCYIVGLRKALRSITCRCLICKLRRGRPQSPMMASLPPGRLAYKIRPFSHCGVDYFGPIQIKVGRRREKRWGVLFTCLTTRAVHLELASSLTAGSAILALQRLAARRGCPSIMYSDNGTNFRGTCKELRDESAKINRDEQREYALQNGMKWLFNPPDAPHMGGAWERLIRSVKTSLNAILGGKTTTEEILYTLLTEIEHSVNSRPLTHVPVDPRDEEALTPNHFLIGTSSGAIKLGKWGTEVVCLRKQWRIAQAFADAFWRRWLREYVPTLIPRKKWLERDSPLRVGDIVLIIDLQASRNYWKTGKVIELYEGADGEIRIAKVKTTNGQFVRPVRKLIKLISEKEVQN